MIYEMRTYYAVAGMIPILNERFEKHIIPVFKQHGIGILGFNQSYTLLSNSDMRVNSHANLVIAGQGTVGLEMLETFPEVDTVIIPTSGGGTRGCGLRRAWPRDDPWEGVRVFNEFDPRNGSLYGDERTTEKVRLRHRAPEYSHEPSRPR